MNSLQYDGALTANVTMESQEGEDSLKANETFSTDPTSGKTVHVSKAETFDPTTSKWVTANEEKSKVEVDEDDFVLYEFSGTDVTATNVDKEYAVSSTGTNPWDLFGSSFKGDVNSLSEILSKMDSFAELYEYLPSMLEMDEDMNLKFSADISTKDNFYILSLKGESFLQDFDYGEIGSESAGAYTFTFDKNTLLSLGVVSYTKSEHLNEKRNKDSKESMVFPLPILSIKRYMNPPLLKRSLSLAVTLKEQSTSNSKTAIFGRVHSEKILTMPLTKLLHQTD